MKHLPPYTGSVRGNWSEGSYSGDSERHVMEDSGNTAFLLLGSKRGPKALGKGGLGQYVYWTRLLSSNRTQSGFVPASLLDITP